MTEPKELEEMREKIAHIKLAEDEGITVDGVPSYIKSEAIGLTEIEDAFKFAGQILAAQTETCRIAVIGKDEIIVSKTFLERLNAFLSKLAEGQSPPCFMDAMARARAELGDLEARKLK